MELACWNKTYASTVLPTPAENISFDQITLNGALTGSITRKHLDFVISFRPLKKIRILQ
jgi:hypothetical protein